MPSSDPPIRVVQCPKCGSPVQGVSTGDIATCSYCGATLQVSAGASGHPVAKLAAIETSTVYLARTEQLKRVREQLGAQEAELDGLQEALDRYERTTSSNQADAPKTALVIGGLLGLLISSMSDMKFFLAALLIAFATWILIMILTSTSLSKMKASVAERSAPIRAQRDRLAQRIAQLEAGLDDLADQL
jgi:uncharacterized Zn finger protein (UPF0148 family)